MNRPNTVADVWKHVDRSSGVYGCWPWTRSLLRDGYGQMRVRGRMIKAHRAAWMAATGREIAAGMCVLHKCDNPRCCNPAHLWLGTNPENTRDKVEKGRQYRPTNRDRSSTGQFQPKACASVPVVTE